MGNGTPVRIKEVDGGGQYTLLEKRLTLIQPFFGEPERFKRLFNNWKNYPKAVLNSLEVIIVDDHGNPTLQSLLTDEVKAECDFSLTVYEIQDDLYHNTPGALNLGILAASTDWLLIMDSDCSFTPDNMTRLMNYKPMNNWIYKFDRQRITNDPELAKNTRYLPCTMLMRKELVMDVNGFDEDFTGARSGGYGFFDNHFDSKVLKAGWKIGRVRSESNIIATEWMEDVVGERVSRTDPELRTNRKLMYEKQEDPNKENNQILRFAWRRVFSSVHNP